MMARWLSAAAAFFLAVAVFSSWSSPAHADSLEDYMERGAGVIAGEILGNAVENNSEKLIKSGHRFLGFLEKVKVGGAFSALLSSVGSIIDIGKAALAKDWREATTQALGWATNLIVGQGIPLLVGAACFAATSPSGPGAAVAAAECYSVTSAAISLIDLPGKAERFIEGLYRRRGKEEPPDAPLNASGRSIDRAEIDVSIDDMVTSARGPGGSAVADVGVVQGGDAKVRVSVDGTISTTTDRGDAYTAIGVAKGGRSQVTVNVDDGVTTQARGRSTATTEIGVANGGRVQVRVGDGVNTLASGSGSAETRIGDSDGSNVSVSVGGSVTTLGNRGSSSTNIGVGKSAFIKGDVLNKGGDLSVGGACRARRNGQCCIQIHRNLCVLRVVPTHKGRCPPRFERYGGLCYLYSDKRHRLEN